MWSNWPPADRNILYMQIQKPLTMVCNIDMCATHMPYHGVICRLLGMCKLNYIESYGTNSENCINWLRFWILKVISYFSSNQNVRFFLHIIWNKITSMIMVFFRGECTQGPVSSSLHLQCPLSFQTATWNRDEWVFYFTGGENGTRGDWGMCQAGIVNKSRNQDLVQCKMAPDIPWKPFCFRAFTSEHTWAEWFGLDCYPMQLRVWVWCVSCLVKFSGERLLL